ncbi:AI-2E family transporter [Leptospira selangorensis]|uniref:AI-2E family transporter n=1 Tax=Leptospira selangorensis TaxID=2484982 RepID=A0ABY2NHN4_9LEPT|nr:AI-2E family transporter [Leptospira selangorensis]TGM27913.1 AI-2E family transporter [Leptospira selangorensis]
MYTKHLPTFMVAVAAGMLLLLTYPFLVPVALASIAAVLLSPIQRKIHEKVPRLPLKAVAGFCVFIFFVAFMTPVGLVLAKALLEVGAFFSDLNGEQISAAGSKKAHQLFAYADQVIDSLGQTFGMQIHFEPLQWIRSALAKVGTWLVANMTAVLGGAPAVFLDIFIFTLALYYFLAEGEHLYQRGIAYLSLPTAKVERIGRAFKEACKSIVLTNVVTGGIQSGLVVITAAFTGFDDLLLIGTITFVSSFIPVLGAAPMAFLLAIIQFAQGDSTDGVILIVMGIVTGSVDNIIRPMLLSGASAMHPLLSFLSIVGGIAAFGLPGLFLGPILLQLSFVVIETYR